jgi:hypothetical protein
MSSPVARLLIARADEYTITHTPVAWQGGRGIAVHAGCILLQGLPRSSAGSLLQLLQSFFHRFVYRPWIVASEASLEDRSTDIRCRYRFGRQRVAA